ncbi:hypothetical protein KR215_005866, partial [Drosophila sulfurigaster]
VKTTLESVETESDHDFVEYFRQVPGSELYAFRVVKLAKSFTMDITIRALKSQRIMYQINKLEGCQFLNNPLMSKAFGYIYQMILANKTLFKCPILPKVYVLQNLRKAKVLPSFHPPGRYQLHMKLKMSSSPAPFVMEVLWKYNVVII